MKITTLKKIKSLKLNEEPFYINVKRDLVAFFNKSILKIKRLSTLENILLESLEFSSIYILSDNKQIFAVSEGKLFIFDIESYKTNEIKFTSESSSLDDEFPETYNIAFFYDNNKIMGIILYNLSLEIVDIVNKKIIREIEEAKIDSLEVNYLYYPEQTFLSIDKKYLAIANSNHLCLFVLKTNEIKANFENFDECFISNVVISPDNTKVAVGFSSDDRNYEYTSYGNTKDRFGVVFDIESGKILYDFQDKFDIDMFENNYASTVHFSSDGKIVIVVIGDRKIYFCNAETGKLIESFNIFNSYGTSCLFEHTENYFGLYKKNPEGLYDLDIYEYIYE